MTDSTTLPRVSVLLPAYNQEGFLAEAIASVYAQTYPNFELIVVNDASRDGTMQVLETLRERYGFTLLHNATNAGVVETLNRALDQAKGEFVALIAGDDTWAPDKLSLQVAYLTSNPEVAGCSGNVRRMDENGAALDEKLQSVREPGFLEFESLLMSRFYFPAPMVMLRAAVLQAVGGFDRRFSYEDWPLWLRLTSAGHRLYLMHEILGSYRIHPNNLHKRLTYLEEQNYRILALYENHPRYGKALRRMRLNNFETATRISFAEGKKRVLQARQCKWRYVKTVSRLLALGIYSCLNRSVGVNKNHN